MLVSVPLLVFGQTFPVSIVAAHDDAQMDHLKY